MINDKENTNLDNSLNNDTNPKEMTTLKKILNVINLLSMKINTSMLNFMVLVPVVEALTILLKMFYLMLLKTMFPKSKASLM